jgi:hypothetical protein
MVGLVASASATTATATATAAIAAASTAAATAAATFFARSGFVDGQRAAVVLAAVQAGNGRLSFGIVAHFHEAEAFAPARVPISDDLSALHGAEFGKHLIQVRT